MVGHHQHERGRGKPTFASGPDRRLFSCKGPGGVRTCWNSPQLLGAGGVPFSVSCRVALDIFADGISKHRCVYIPVLPGNSPCMVKPRGSRTEELPTRVAKRLEALGMLYWGYVTDMCMC